MACVFICPKYKARKRFECDVVELHQTGTMYMYPPTTRLVECTCGEQHRVELSWGTKEDR